MRSSLLDFVFFLSVKRDMTFLDSALACIDLGEMRSIIYSLDFEFFQSKLETKFII